MSEGLSLTSAHVHMYSQSTFQHMRGPSMLFRTPVALISPLARAWQYASYAGWYTCHNTGHTPQVERSACAPERSSSGKEQHMLWSCFNRLCT